MAAPQLSVVSVPVPGSVVVPPPSPETVSVKLPAVASLYVVASIV